LKDTRLYCSVVLLIRVLLGLCTNPTIEDRLKADTLGIRREIVINGALFEELEVSNYSTSPVRVEMSISFNADFVDLFEIRGFNREKRGKILRLVQEETAVERATEQLTLAYQGLDGSVMESRIQFQHRQPDCFNGYTAVWQLELASHETQNWATGSRC
jgi:glycogen debranching enzyme